MYEVREKLRIRPSTMPIFAYICLVVEVVGLYNEQTAEAFRF